MLNWFYKFIYRYVDETVDFSNDMDKIIRFNHWATTNINYKDVKFLTSYEILKYSKDINVVYGPCSWKVPVIRAHFKNHADYVLYKLSKDVIF